MKTIVSLVLIIMLLTGNVLGYNIYDEEEEGEYVETATSIGVPNLNARAAILYDSTYDRILYEKNSKQRRANASTTKMITALVAYENGNLEDVIEVSQKAASVGGSTIKLKTGDRITLDDLIKGLLVHSGNDAAVAIAEYIAGNVDEFSYLMNKKVEEIGAVDTNFITPHGLDEDNHYSTAFDLMLIAKEVLKNPYLSNIINQKSVEITINGNTRIINTTNEILSSYEGGNGIKTGYTGNAGRCLVASAKIDARQLISVVLGCDSKKNRTIDTIRLLDYGFKEYTVIDLAQYIKNDMYIIVDKSEGGLYKVSKEMNLLYPIKDTEKDKITFQYDIPKNLVAPLKKGEMIGTVRVLLDGVEIKKAEYYLPEDINRKTWREYFYKILEDSLENYENMVEKMFKI